MICRNPVKASTLCLNEPEEAGDVAVRFDYGSTLDQNIPFSGAKPYRGFICDGCGQKLIDEGLLVEPT